MQNKVIVVTGAFGALGTAVARAFSNQGAAVAMLGHAPQVPVYLESMRNDRVALLPGIDLATPDDAKAAMDAVASRFGGIDALVNVAGGFRSQTLDEGGIAIWDELYSLNLKTTVVATKAVLPHLLARGAGRVINVGAGSAAGRAAAGMGAYAASKAGVQRLTESLAKELRDRRITVNAVLPGTIDTERNRTEMPTANFTRWVTPAELADVIMFFASDAARAVTGASLPVLGRG
jgi:NAD(P)-dependent dehydrogenase (short-subunit alcohol dehydrogenase family)